MLRLCASGDKQGKHDWCLVMKEHRADTDYGRLFDQRPSMSLRDWLGRYLGTAECTRVWQTSPCHRQ